MTPDTPIYDEYMDETRRRRGTIIEQTVIIERFIDIYIASNYCGHKSKRDALISDVLASRHLSAESKRKIFMDMLAKKEKRFLKQNEKQLDKISDVYIWRNYYSHQLIVADEEAVKRYSKNKSITFFRFSDGKKNLTKDEYFQLIKKAADCATLVRKLLQRRKYLPSTDIAVRPSDHI